MEKAKRARAKASVKKRAGAKRKSAAKRPRRKARTPFSPATLKKLRELLIEHKDRIMGDVASLRQTHLRSSQRDSTGDLSGYSLHMADMGTDTYDREFGLAVATTEGNIVYLIDLALRRIEEKSYGLCEACGRSIKMERLKAVPWARLCIACKEVEEMEGRNPEWQQF
jgi:RNA polymerase-binding protein DksA